MLQNIIDSIIGKIDPEKVDPNEQGWFAMQWNDKYMRFMSLPSFEELMVDMFYWN